METEMQITKNEKLSEHAPFGFHPRKAIWMSASGMAIGMFLFLIVAIPTANASESWQILRMTLLGVLLGGCTGFMLSMAEANRRPVLRLTLAGLLAGGLSFLLFTTLDQSFQWKRYATNISLSMGTALLWGWVLGGRKSLARMSLYGLLTAGVAILAEILTSQLQPGYFINILKPIPKYLLMGAVLGWAVGREFPTSEQHASLLSKKVVSEQYSRKKIFGLWALATLPMISLAWGVAPFLISRLPGLPAIVVYLLAIVPGMVWQLTLSLWIIRREEGNLRWETIRRRTWLNPPLQPQTGQPNRRLYVWLLPCIVVAGLGFALEIGWPLLAFVFQSPYLIFPFWLTSFTNILEFAGPIFSGQWWALGLALVFWVLSALLAEEFFFRGVLLPKMSGAFGKKDWLVNAILYSIHYLYKPWMILFRLIAALVIAWPARRFRSYRIAVSIRAVEGVGFVAVMLVGILSPGLRELPTKLTLPYISRQTAVDEYLWTNNRVKTELPVYDPNAENSHSIQMDLRSSDLSQFDLQDSSKDLFYATFNNVTTWPPSERMPADFNPGKIMELGKNPGLGLRQLHAQGITGKGVGVAVIDMPLLTNHQEYAARLKWYEEVGVVGAAEKAQMHGTATSSIAVGQTVGVAPQADLYFISFGNNLKSGLLQPQGISLAIRRILQINQQLPEGQKIRVISISTGWAPTNFDAQAAFKEAEEAGMFFSIAGPANKFDISGIGRDPLANPDDFEAYKPGLFWAQDYYDGTYQPMNGFMVPMDARTTASPTGASNYVYYPDGGLSWSIPYIAGIYALAAQVDPSITPEGFLELALETGRTIDVEHDRQSYPLGPIVDPQALIAALQAGQ